MKCIWTIQTEHAWDVLRENGVLYGDGRRVWGEHRAAYKWMMEQMRQRLPSCAGHWPIWAWIRWSTHSPCPDLRASSHLMRGERGVRITLLIPEESFLPHDFEMWHAVLGNDYASWDEREQDRWERRERSRACTARKIQREKEKTWERIFDLTSTNRDAEWCCMPDEMSIAAVLERITLDQVQNIHHFIAR